MKGTRLIGLLAAVIHVHAAFGQTKTTGLVFADEDAYKSIPLATTPLLGTLPKETDLSGRFPTPGDQGQQASCVGWAVAYGLKSYQEGVERKWDLKKPEHRFSPAYIYNQIKISDHCNGGSRFIDAFNILRREGVAPLKSFKYSEKTCNELPSEAIKQIAREFLIADWRRVNVQDETEMKHQLAAGFPVLAGIMVDMGFMKLSKKQIYRETSGKELGGHAVVVVGYSDEIKAFKIMNSWGDDWADSGFGFVSYEAFRKIVREGYTAQDVVAITPDPEPMPEPSPDNEPVPPPQPRPRPIPKQVSVELGIPMFHHDVGMNIPTMGGMVPAFRINLSGVVRNGKGKTIQAIAKFSYPNGYPIKANPAEPKYRDAGGVVTAFTIPTTIGSDNEDLGTLFISMPYHALNFPATNYQMTQDLTFVVTVLIDNQPVDQSMPTSFRFRW